MYKFFVATADVDPSTQLFFNLIFGDYDVVPANVTLTFASAPARTVTLTTQPGAADGLIQAASALLNFTEVFTAHAGGGWDGFLRVDFIAPNEPYTAFDFTELSVTKISTDLPEPATLALLGLGLAGLGFSRRKQ